MGTMGYSWPQSLKTVSKSRDCNFPDYLYHPLTHQTSSSPIKAPQHLLGSKVYILEHLEDLSLLAV